MKHRTLVETREVANIHDRVPGTTVAPMSRDERLERWAELLQQQETPLTSLFETEYAPSNRRRRMRADHSALSVAYADPVLRGQGLAGDSYGEAVRFFELTDDEAHYILCHCHCGPSVEGRQLARRVHQIAAYQGLRSSVLLPLAVVSGLGLGGLFLTQLIAILH